MSAADDAMIRCPWIFLIIAVVMHGDVLAGDWAVHVPNDPIHISSGSSVTLPCTYDFPEESGSHRVLSEMWCLNQTLCITPTYVYHSAGIFPEPAYRGRVQYLGTLGSKNCTLKITNLKMTDSGIYVFRFITDHRDSKLPGQKGVAVQVTEQSSGLNILAIVLGILITLAVAAIILFCVKRCVTSRSLQIVQSDDGKL